MIEVRCRFPGNGYEHHNIRIEQREQRRIKYTAPHFLQVTHVVYIARILSIFVHYSIFHAAMQDTSHYPLLAVVRIYKKSMMVYKN